MSERKPSPSPDNDPVLQALDSAMETIRSGHLTDLTPLFAIEDALRTTICTKDADGQIWYRTVEQIFTDTERAAYRQRMSALLDLAMSQLDQRADEGVHTILLGFTETLAYRMHTMDYGDVTEVRGRLQARRLEVQLTELRKRIATFAASHQEQYEANHWLAHRIKEEIGFVAGDGADITNLCTAFAEAAITLFMNRPSMNNTFICRSVFDYLDTHGIPTTPYRTRVSDVNKAGIERFLHKTTGGHTH